MSCPPLLVDPSVLICIDLVLPTGWVNSPDFFYSVSKTVANNANGYALDPASTFVVYPPTVGVYNTVNGATASANHIQYVDVYVDDLLCAAQEHPTQQQRISDLTIHALK